MPEKQKCPRCADGQVTRCAGKLEQSGKTYLPTSVWTCDVCGYVRYDAAAGVRWRSL